MFWSGFLNCGIIGICFKLNISGGLWHLLEARCELETRLISGEVLRGTSCSCGIKSLRIPKGFLAMASASNLPLMSGLALENHSSW